MEISTGGGGGRGVLRNALIQFTSLSLLAVSLHLVLSLLKPSPLLQHVLSLRH